MDLYINCAPNLPLVSMISSRISNKVTFLLSHTHAPDVIVMFRLYESLFQSLSGRQEACAGVSVLHSCHSSDDDLQVCVCLIDDVIVLFCHWLSAFWVNLFMV